MPTTERLTNTIAMLGTIEIVRLGKLSHTTVNTPTIFVVRPEAMEAVSLAALSLRHHASEYLDGTINSTHYVAVKRFLA
jgi:hypothetical protein